MHFHGLHAHDVGDLASVARLVVLRLSREREHVLGRAALRAIAARDLLVVPEPDNLRRRISTA